VCEYGVHLLQRALEPQRRTLQVPARRRDVRVIDGRRIPIGGSGNFIDGVVYAKCGVARSVAVFRVSVSRMGLAAQAANP
jgi:hypothetical protein